MWFNKNHPNTLYIDIRKEKKGFEKSRPNCEINPDVIADFRNLRQFKDKSFKLIVWDPPHMISKNYGSRMTNKYGFLYAETWPYDFKLGFKELWRVLDHYGVLLFKFNDTNINFRKVLKLFPINPLFSNTISNKKGSKTKWFCFMKIPEKK